MPKVKRGEKSQDYISRCVSHLIKKEGKSQKEALGQCYGMLRHARGKETLRKPTKKLKGK